MTGVVEDSDCRKVKSNHSVKTMHYATHVDEIELVSTEEIW